MSRRRFAACHHGKNLRARFELLRKLAEVVMLMRNQSAGHLARGMRVLVVSRSTILSLSLLVLSHCHPICYPSGSCPNRTAISESSPSLCPWVTRRLRLRTGMNSTILSLA